MSKENAKMLLGIGSMVLSLVFMGIAMHVVRLFEKDLWQTRNVLRSTNGRLQRAEATIRIHEREEARRRQWEDALNHSWELRQAAYAGRPDVSSSN